MLAWAGQPETPTLVLLHHRDLASQPVASSQQPTHVHTAAVLLFVPAAACGNWKRCGAAVGCLAGQHGCYTAVSASCGLCAAACCGCMQHTGRRHSSRQQFPFQQQVTRPWQLACSAADEAQANMCCPPHPCAAVLLRCMCHCRKPLRRRTLMARSCQRW